jgi:hypothetical protein
MQDQRQIPTRDFHPTSWPSTKWFLNVVVTLCRDIKVGEILFAVESDCFGFDFAVFDVDFVPTEDDGNTLADTDVIAMPVGDILVCNSRSHVKHDDTTLS